jgi:hypothetical protein
MARCDTAVHELLQQAKKRFALVEVERIGLVDEQHGVCRRPCFRAEGFSIESCIAREKVVSRTAKRSCENA